MKKEKILGLVVFSIMILNGSLPTFSFAQCDSTELGKAFRKSDPLPTWNKNNPGNYAVSSPKEKTIEVTYHDSVYVVPFDYANGDYKIVRVKNDFLELIVFHKQGNYDSYFFIKGIEIHKILLYLNPHDNFAVKLTDDKIIFKFDKYYNSYNFSTQKFCKIN